MGRTRAWRSYARVASERLNRAPYYGVGNETPEVDSLNELDPPYYRYQLLRTTAYGVYQREIVRHVRLHGAVQLRHYRSQPLGPNTLYAQDIAAGVVPDSGSANSAELRLGVLYDTRDEEATPTRGAFLEGMWATSFGDHTYDRYLVSARGFIPFGEFDDWVLGLRQTAELATGTVPFYVSYERLTTWYLEDGFGGERSLRLQPQGRYVAPNRYVASVDLRKKLYDVPWPTSPVRLWALAFADFGRLWDKGETPNIEGHHWSAGIGSRLQISKGTLFGLDIGSSDAGPGFAISTVFAF
jgi:outer membrane protein assembly factor BamA